jgi:hypothetical protein
MFESDEFDNKKVEPPVGHEAFSAVETSATKTRRKQRKPKNQASTKVRGKQRDLKSRVSEESETAFILVNTEDSTCEILSEEDLTAAGAKVINDKKLNLFRAVQLEPTITFSNTNHT